MYGPRSAGRLHQLPGLFFLSSRPHPERTICAFEQAFRILEISRDNQVGFLELGDLEQLPRNGVLVRVASLGVRFARLRRHAVCRFRTLARDGCVCLKVIANPKRSLEERGNLVEIANLARRVQRGKKLILFQCWSLT